MRRPWVALVLAGCNALLGIHDFQPSSQDGGSGFDVTSCPSSYTHQFPMIDARFRWDVINAAGMVSWQAAEMLCEADGSSLHLAVFDNFADEQAVWNAAGSDLSYPYVWSGVWLVGSVYVTLFDTAFTPTFQSPQPIVQPGSGVSPQQGLAYGIYMGQPQFGDIEWPVNFGADIICECDGRVVQQRAPNPPAPATASP
jgi:hypothetical protein